MCHILYSTTQIYVEFQSPVLNHFIMLFPGVIIFTAIANRFRLHQLSTVEKFVMSYGGLRGAVAFALVLLIDPKVVPLQPMFMTTTIAVVYFTVFIQGITIKPLVKFLNVKTAEKRKPSMNERIHERVSSDYASNVTDQQPFWCRRFFNCPWVKFVEF